MTEITCSKATLSCKSNDLSDWYHLYVMETPITYQTNIKALEAYFIRLLTVIVATMPHGYYIIFSVALQVAAAVAWGIQDDAEEINKGWTSDVGGIKHLSYLQSVHTGLISDYNVPKETTLCLCKSCVF